ncbi:unnamed protein product [Acanthoscelides obtectus]|uniref:Uncharacterized protein n=1 Tax=Acanthoscelides obtectus TaxID=200917 RepID=A0A9P0L4U5_ACAOB|nr:unnamed protein product [Acanthoscelides obtectus]CAK1641519.1 hypothetical protein AOBTE_LOCUS12460 [Acanthoscelides obtectus]
MAATCRSNHKRRQSVTIGTDHGVFSKSHGSSYRNHQKQFQIESDHRLLCSELLVCDIIFKLTLQLQRMITPTVGFWKAVKFSEILPSCPVFVT